MYISLKQNVFNDAKKRIKDFSFKAFVSIAEAFGERYMKVKGGHGKYCVGYE